MSNTHKAIILATISFAILAVYNSIWFPDKILTAKEVYATLAFIGLTVLTSPFIHPKK